MNTLIPHAFTRDEVERWGVANPRLGLILPLLKFMGVLNDVDVVYVRAPIGWIEWFWSLFGYIYQETVPEVHIDWRAVGIVLAIVVLAIISLIYASSKAASMVVRLIYDGATRMRAAVSHFCEQCAHIFRVQASSIDPGPHHSLVACSTVLESSMPGSPLVRFVHPPFQVILSYVDSERKRRVVGCAIRLRTPTGEDYLVVPLHVWSVFDRDFPNVHARGKGDWIELDSRSVSLKGAVVERDVVNIDTDVICVRISENEASRLGASVPKIGAAGSAGFVRIVGPNSLGSTGTLRPDPVVFGHYIYTGSTEAGFSGAAYTNGNFVFAIHLGGGQRNFGYSVRLAYVTLLHFRKIKQESTEQWIEDMVRKKGERVIVDTSWHDTDTVRIRVRWDYHVIEKDKFYGSLGEDNPNIDYRDFSKPEQSYVKHCGVPEANFQGNCKTMACVGDGRSSIDCIQESPQLCHHGMNDVSSCSKTSQKAQSAKSGKKQKKTLSGQIPTVMPTTA
nr:hypothetical protein [Solemoviridae sp.]